MYMQNMPLLTELASFILFHCYKHSAPTALIFITLGILFKPAGNFFERLQKFRAVA